MNLPSSVVDGMIVLLRVLLSDGSFRMTKKLKDHSKRHEVGTNYPMLVLKKFLSQMTCFPCFKH